MEKNQEKTAAKQIAKQPRKPKRTKINPFNFAGSAMGIMCGAKPTIVHPPESGYDELTFSSNREQLIIVEHVGDGDGAAGMIIQPPPSKSVANIGDVAGFTVDSETGTAYISTRDIPNAFAQAGDYVFNVSGKSSIRVTAIGLS